MKTAFRLFSWAAILVYLSVLHGIVLAAFLYTSLDERIALKLGFTSRQEFSADFSKVSVKLLDIDEKALAQSVVILGDSRLADLNLSERLAKAGYPVVDLTAGGESTATLMVRLVRYRSVDDAALILIGVGLNDLFYRSVSTTGTRFARMLDSLPQDRPVLLMEVGLVNSDRHDEISNEEIINLNFVLAGLCSARQNCVLFPHPLNGIDKTRLEEKHDAGDGMHYSKEGNVILQEKLTTAIDLVLSEKDEDKKADLPDLERLRGFTD